MNKWKKYLGVSFGCLIITVVLVFILKTIPAKICGVIGVFLSLYLIGLSRRGYKLFGKPSKGVKKDERIE